MLTLSPAKILVVLVVALIVLGPEKLPGMARQIGAAWGDLRRFRARLENEVRGVFPDLPPAHEVAQAVRSPLAFLDRLADEHDRGGDSADNGSANGTNGSGSTDAPSADASSTGAGGAGAGDAPSPGAGADGAGPAPRPAGRAPALGDVALPGVAGDPSMN